MPDQAPRSWKAVAHNEGENFVLQVETGASQEGAEFYPFSQDAIDDAADQSPKPEARGVRLTLVQSQFMSAVPATLDGLLVLPSGKAYVISAPVVAGASVAPIVAGATPVANAAAPIVRSSFAGLMSTLWFAFVGGLILNLMPCVLPVLSLKVLSLAEAGHGELAHAREHGLLYLAGVVVSFWALAAVLATLRLAGQQVGWGFQMQSPTVVMFLSGLMFLIGLNLLGVFKVGGALMGIGGSLAQRSGRAGSFFTGSSPLSSPRPARRHSWASPSASR